MLISFQNNSDEADKNEQILKVERTIDVQDVQELESLIIYASHMEFLLKDKEIIREPLQRIPLTELRPIAIRNKEIKHWN